jgi:hypothetical protein
MTVLVGSPTPRHEHWLQGRVTVAKVMHFGACATNVVLIGGPGEGAQPVSPVRLVGVAIVLSAAAVVKTRKVATVVVENALRKSAAGAIQGPAH